MTVIFPKSGQDDVFVSFSRERKGRELSCDFLYFCRSLAGKNGTLQEKRRFRNSPPGGGFVLFGKKKEEKSRKTILTFLWLYDLNSGHRQETEIAAADTPRIPPYQERSPIPVPIFAEKII